MLLQLGKVVGGTQGSGAAGEGRTGVGLESCPRPLPPATKWGGNGPNTKWRQLRVRVGLGVAGEREDPGRRGPAVAPDPGDGMEGSVPTAHPPWEVAHPLTWLCFGSKPWMGLLFPGTA